MDLIQLRTYARTLFDVGVRAADPYAAVTRELSASPLPNLNEGCHIILAIGKAASAMISATLEHIPSGNNVEAIAVTNYENAVDIKGCTVFAAGHPVPDKNGLKASKAVVKLLETTGVSDHVLCLISGGGSALLPAPVDGITLDDKIIINQLLLANGFDIIETNLIRQQLSKLKGGRLARLAAPAPVRSIIISDVIGDNPSTIASGPTAKPLGTQSEAIVLLKGRDIWQKIPTSVQDYLSTPQLEKLSVPESVHNKVVSSNRQSLEAIASFAKDWDPTILSSTLGGDVANAAQIIVDQIKELPPQKNQLLIWGGETTVQIQGTGKGGRNQELALRVSQLSDDLDGHWVFLSGGTDGRDGPTDSAGGIVDMTTNKRSQIAHLNVEEILANNDSYTGLNTLNDLLVVGPTGTNVADIQLFLRVH